MLVHFGRLSDQGRQWYSLADADRYTMADYEWYNLADAAWYIIARLLTKATFAPPALKRSIRAWRFSVLPSIRIYEWVHFTPGARCRP